MKLTISSVLVTLLLSSIVVRGWVDQPEVNPSNLKSLTTEPIAKPRNGKNVALTLEVKSLQGRLPRGVSILLNGKQVNLTDDGRWPDAQAGDGIYSIAGRTTDGKPLEGKTVLRLDSSSHHAEAPSISCTFRRVECPKDCKSIIFGSKCVVCVEFTECTISFLE